MQEQKYFGAAVIEKDFSKNALSKTQKVVMDSKKKKCKIKFNLEKYQQHKLK